MSKQSLLLVDGDMRSLRVLEVSLRKAGFTVTPAASVQDALDKLELHAPDLIISETTFTDGDGFELRRRVRAVQDWADIPFIFLTAEAAIENKIRGLELGVDDYLTKPIYIKEIVTRINILLQKRQRARFEERKDGRTRFAGRVADMPVVDVIQTIEISRKSGVIQFVGERGRQAAIYFRDGRVIDAEAGTLQGEDAVYRLLTWSEGEFEVVFRTVRRREVISTSSQGLLMEGMRRLDEWSRLLEQLPPLTHRFEIDAGELSVRLGDVPDDNNRILRLLDGKRTLLEVIDASDFGDLECLQAIARLYFEELLIDLDDGEAPRRDTGKPMPLVEVETSDDLHTRASDSGPVPEQPDPAAPSQSARVADTMGVSESQVVEESPAEAPVPRPVDSEHSLPSQPLMGAYRPSGLLRIDQAIAAAQAIDPLLFDDGALASQPRVTDPDIAAAVGANPSDFAEEERTAAGLSAMGEPAAASTNGVPVSTDAEDDSSIPQEIPPESEDNGLPSSRMRPRSISVQPAARVTGPVSRVSRNEESGLRMITSQSMDRAETSGELVPMAPPVEKVRETQRELVTILPRRITREMAVVTPADVAAASTPTPPAPPVEPPAREQSGPVIARKFTPTAGGVVVAKPQGPSIAVIGLALVAAVLVGTVAFVALRKADRTTPPDDPVQGTGVAVIDAGVTSADAQPVAIVVDAAPLAVDAATVARVDAAPVVDAAAPVATVDAPPPSRPDAAVSPEDSAEAQKARARQLYEQANEANQEGDFTAALDLADQSLRIRRTSRAFIVRAQAQQRLGRLDEALASMDQAIELAPEFAGNYEALGNILWAAQRYDEAAIQYEEYLKRQPTGETAQRIKNRLAQPR